MKLLSALYLFSSASVVAANVEKTIFLGPELVRMPQQPPNLASLDLHTLTTGNNSIRTRLDRTSPSKSEDAYQASRGYESWLLLDGLTEGQRYEVRVCWAAIEPTSFDLEAFPVNESFDTPAVMESLSSYAFDKMAASELEPTPHIHDAFESEDGEMMSSVLLLRVIAAADYFTDNADLMKNPPPVLVDLILDPFLFNMLPRSLLPTVGYILVVTAVSFVAARFIMSYLRSIASDDETKKKQ